MARGHSDPGNWLVSSTGCWVWLGPHGRSGYGPMKRMYERHVGPKPFGYDLHHTCRNGKHGCVNPAHMELMPMNEHRKMHRHETCTLTVDQAKEIRELLLDLSLPTYVIADRYGVTRFIVERIGSGKYWPDASGGVPLEYEQVCPFCGELFVTTSRRQRYCSTRHRIRFNNRKQHRRRAAR